MPPSKSFKKRHWNALETLLIDVGEATTWVSVFAAGAVSFIGLVMLHL